MRRRTTHAQRAFTLVELMIVVAVVGVLSTLATYGVRKYIANAKTAEARASLGRIANASAIAFEKEIMAGVVLSQGSTAGLSHALCGTAQSGPVPQTAPKGAKYQSALSDWQAPADVAANSGFACLRFTIDEPQYYSYMYTRSGAGSALGDGFAATAAGDLNGDGVTSLFTLRGTIESGMVLSIAPSLQEQNPDE